MAVALCLVLLAGFCFFCGRCDRPGETADGVEIPELRLGGPAFGTTYNARIRLPPATTAGDDGAASGQSRSISGEDLRIIESDIRKEIERINRAMSNWQADSEISRFNRHGTAPFRISADFSLVLHESLELYRQSSGAFDPAKDTLFELWGFGGGQVKPPRTERSVPAQADIDRIQRTSGMQNLILGTVNGRPTLRKRYAELRLNLSAIAKGYGVDRVYTMLTEHPLLRGPNDSASVSVMIEIGGELRVGPRVAGRAWNIGIERPEYSGARSLFRVLPLENVAMATSGDYRNYFTANGARYSHILDPRTGRPERSGVAQATVVGPRCMIADGLATTLLVLGETDGLKLMEAHPGYEALMLIASTDDPDKGEQAEPFRVVTTPGMQRWLP